MNGLADSLAATRRNPAVEDLVKGFDICQKRACQPVLDAVKNGRMPSEQDVLNCMSHIGKEKAFAIVEAQGGPQLRLFAEQKFGNKPIPVIIGERCPEAKTTSFPIAPSVFRPFPTFPIQSQIPIFDPTTNQTILDALSDRETIIPDAGPQPQPQPQPIQQQSAEGEGEGKSNTMLIVGGVALLGIAGFLAYKMTR